MSFPWNDSDGGAQDKPRGRVSNQNSGKGSSGGACPWAQDTDVDQFKRGPPTSSKGVVGNPINHTGYAEAVPAHKKKGGSARGPASVPWAQDQVNSFAKPANAIGAGLARGESQPSYPVPPPQQSQRSGRDEYEEQQYAQQQYAQQQYAQQQYAEPLEDDEEPMTEEEYQRHLQMALHMQQRAPAVQQQAMQAAQYVAQKTIPKGSSGGGVPWAQSFDEPMQSESRSQFQGGASGQNNMQQALRKNNSNRQMTDENYNMLHDGYKSSYEKEKVNSAHHNDIVNYGAAAAADSRQAAKAIRDKMTGGGNLISWN